MEKHKHQTKDELVKLGNFNILDVNTIQSILGYLDTTSLSNMSKTSKQLHYQI